MRRAFLCLLGGGTGFGAGVEITRLWRRVGMPFPLRMVAIDADERDQTTSPFNSFVSIGMSGRELDAMKATVENFGPEAVTILENYAEYLHREKVRDGARARRALTQFFVEFHRDTLISEIRQQVMDLMSTAEIDHIQPVIVGSSGGGCGSALIVLLSNLLADQTSRDRILAGFDDVVLYRPVSYAADPYAKSNRNNEIQQALIYSNAYALRMECDALLRSDRLAEVNLSGLSNDAGVVLRTVGQLHQHLGSVVFWSMKNNATIASVKANYGYTHYMGADMPENRLGHRSNDGLPQGGQT